ncbi:MAG: alpha-galactosidase [Coprobacter sp.]|nr:alpha-galactosidase [Coprobacter sp.]
MKKILSLSLSLLTAMVLEASAAVKVYNFDKWTLGVDNATGDVTIIYAGDTLVNRSNASWGVNDDRTTMSQCAKIRSSIADNKDIYGTGKVVTLKATHGKSQVSQMFYLYTGKNYMHTELKVSSPEGVALNYMAPINSASSYTLFEQAGNYSLFVPFDNDAFIRYRTFVFGEPTESYGVTAFFNTDSREGLVVGAIEHTDWKTGIQAVTSGVGTVDTLCVYGGASTTITRDLIPHGKVLGKTVKSPRITLGMFADWRAGMEAFGDQCATFAPKIPSLGARPFGWNSWGALATKITFDKAIEVSDFIRENIQNKSFENEGVVYIDLDAFWDFGFKHHQHKIFVEHCRANNQKPGIYWCPFTDWGKNAEAKVVGDMDYKWKDVYIRANGEPVVFDGGIAIDPTHPAVRRRIETQMKQFIEWGYEYVKIDFMAHGTYQSDSYYDKNITTGMQAYNQGMKYLVEQTEGKLWINLSIAPLFPGNYAHSRRISCDAWADINNTEYVLNSLSYGWWLDHIYHYNDGDHIVYKEVSDGENRARITSSAITGVYFLGDDMSKGGTDEVKNKVVRNTTNPGINEIARTCPSFRPVEIGSGDRGSDMFYHNRGDVLYVAIFNFAGKSAEKQLPLHRLGLSGAIEYDAVELWSGDKTKIRAKIAVEVPAKDVKVYRIDLKK